MQLMNKIALSGLMAISIGATPSLSASPMGLLQEETQPTHKYNYESINEALKLVVQPLLQGDDQLANLALHIDAEQTDLSQDKIKMDAALTLESTAWSSMPTAINSSLLVDVEPASEKQSAVINMATMINMQTDTLALLHQTAKKSHAMACSEEAEAKGLKAIHQQEGCSALAVIMEAETLDQMQSAMLGYKNAVVARLQEFLEEARPSIEATQSQLLKEEGQLLLQKTQRVIDIMANTTFADANGGFIINIPEVSKEPLLTLHDLQVHLTPKTLMLQSEITMKDHLGLYKAIKPELERILRGLENKETIAIEQMRMLLRMDLAVIEQLLSAHN